MAAHTLREKEIVRNNILKLDAAIVRLLEKRIGYATELKGELPLPLMRDELLNLVIDENKADVMRVMELINQICFED